MLHDKGNRPDFIFCALHLCSLLMQAFSQVTDSLIHHGHLGVPLVQQLLILGQLAALLQIVPVTSLKKIIFTHIYDF